eukprot:g3271.t1
MFSDFSREMQVRSWTLLRFCQECRISGPLAQAFAKYNREEKSGDRSNSNDNEKKSKVPFLIRYVIRAQVLYRIRSSPLDHLQHPFRHEMFLRVKQLVASTGRTSFKQLYHIDIGMRPRNPSKIGQSTTALDNPLHWSPFASACVVCVVLETATGKKTALPSFLLHTTTATTTAVPTTTTTTTTKDNSAKMTKPNDSKKKDRKASPSSISTPSRSITQQQNILSRVLKKALLFSEDRANNLLGTKDLLTSRNLGLHDQTSGEYGDEEERELDEEIIHFQSIHEDWNQHVNNCEAVKFMGARHFDREPAYAKAITTVVAVEYVREMRANVPYRCISRLPDVHLRREVSHSREYSIYTMGDGGTLANALRSSSTLGSTTAAASAGNPDDMTTLGLSSSPHNPSHNHQATTTTTVSAQENTIRNSDHVMKEKELPSPSEEEEEDLNLHGSRTLLSDESLLLEKEEQKAHSFAKAKDSIHLMEEDNSLLTFKIRFFTSDEADVAFGGLIGFESFFHRRQMEIEETQAKL